MPNVTNAVLADRMDILKGDICQLVEKLNKLLDRDIEFKISYERRHADLVKDIEVHQKEILALKDIVSNQGKQIESLTTLVNTLTISVDSLKKTIGTATKFIWALIIPLVLFLTGTLWGLITHSISIIVK